MTGAGEATPLLGPAPSPRRSHRSWAIADMFSDEQRQRRSSRICIFLFGLGCIGFITAILLSLKQYNSMQPHKTIIKNVHQNRNSSRTSENSIPFSVFSLMVWGSPGSFGTEDKELRIQAIGNLTSNPDWDVMLLSDLWMRPDHATIRSMLPEGHDMTTVDDLSLSSCDGSIAPEFCSGLAIISKFPILEVEFTSFDVSGDLLWDYEYFLRRGLGRVRIEPQPEVKVDVFVTSLASMDYNYWYRERQATQLVKLVSESTADYVVLGGDFNVDPRDGEDTYTSVKNQLIDAVEEFYKHDQSKYLDPSLATLGNPKNSYTSKGEHPVLYDYIWYKAGQSKTMNVVNYQVPNLKSQGEKNVSLSSHEAVVAQMALS